MWKIIDYVQANFLRITFAALVIDKMYEYLYFYF